MNLLWALPGLLLLLFLYAWWRARVLARLAAPVSAVRLLPGWSSVRFWTKNALVLVALALLAFAWANPQRGARQQTVTQQSTDVFIALDISRSMLAEDVAPSRLELAKSFVRKLIRALQGERIGLIFFAGDAFLQMPLSTDYAAADMFVAAAHPDLITAQGTAIPRAIDLATEYFDPDPRSGRALILITDAEDHNGDAADRAARAYSDGIAIFAVGAGTVAGGPIPLGDAGDAGQYKRDEEGAIVRTRMDEVLLQKLAAAGGGAAYRIPQGDAAVQAIRREVGRLQKRAMEVRSFSEFESCFQWFLLPAFFLLLLETWFSWRKKSALLAFLLCVSGPALFGQSAHQLLRDGDRRYEGSNYQEAEQAYRQAGEKMPNDPKVPYNAGNALYRQGNYADAEKRYEQAARIARDPALQADALHNLGNTYLQQQKYQEAVQAYENSLRRRPADPETKMNLQLAKKKYQQEQEQKKQQQEQKQEDTSAGQQPEEQPQQPQPNPNQQSQQQNPQQQPADQEQQSADGKMTREQARRVLETAVSPEDKRNARKYREQEPGKHQAQPKKDW
ncbi:MAG: VWA domain-containing protein [Lewinellaceae bacterium]|nr:VWA domain-containing protein [Lewinellaceae bacterium]